MGKHDKDCIHNTLKVNKEQQEQEEQEEDEETLFEIPKFQTPKYRQFHCGP